MIILDTCALIFDALNPKKLTLNATQAIVQAEKKEQLFCCDISLWEIAMLVQKNRLMLETDTQTFLNLMLAARAITVLEINPAIAALSAQDYFKHQDPSDRLIASTALHYQATLITSDQKLMKVPDLKVIW